MREKKQCVCVGEVVKGFRGINRGGVERGGIV